MTSDNLQLKEKEEQIELLEEELSRFYRDQVSLSDISTEAKILYPEIEKMGYYKQVNTDFVKTDTTLVFEISWDKKVTQREIEEGRKKLESWLRHKLNNPKIDVRLWDNQ